MLDVTGVPNLLLKKISLTSIFAKKQRLKRILIPFIFWEQTRTGY